MAAQRRRLALALGLSVLAHTLLLSLTFGGLGPGLPGFALPWRERRIEAPDLRVVLMPARATAVVPKGPSIHEPALPASMVQPLVGEPASTLSVSPGLATGRAAELAAPAASPNTDAKPQPQAAQVAVAIEAPSRGSVQAAPPPAPEPKVIAMERAQDATPVVPAATPLPAPVVAAAPAASNPQDAMPSQRAAGDAAQERIDAAAQARAVELAEREAAAREAQAAQLEAARIETARQDAARQEARRVERARLDAAAAQEAARQEAAWMEAARREAALQEAARQEAVRQDARRIEAARLEAQRLEALRLAAAQAAQQAAAQQETARQEAALAAARQEAAQQAARVEAARIEAARIEATNAETARREAARRAMGRQLDEEAARREDASAAADLPPRLPPSSSAARRGRLFGRTDANPELVLYAEAWARKIQLNMTFDMVREVAKRPHTHPLVTVAIRSDGSVESITFVTSSGVAEIDEAIRRIVQSQLPYPAFPPALAREFDVIEIRRTWYFDMAVRLY